MSDPQILSLTDAQFVDVYRWCLANGHLKDDRTGVGTVSADVAVMRFDCRDKHIPIFSLRRIIVDKFMHEMHFFISGKTSIKYLRDNKVGIWDSWFIKGTDVYDVPSIYTYTLQERADLAIALGLAEQLNDYADFEMTRHQGAEYTVVDLTLNPETDPWDLFESEVTQVEEWLTNKGIPTSEVRGGKRVSLQKRLTRVSKNDSVKWEVINGVIAEPWEKLAENSTGERILNTGEDVKITVFVDNQFKDIAVRPIVAQAIVVTLDELGVPAYPLVDADIGKGAYGAQWRAWQDTQMIPVYDKELRDQYYAQGYELQGFMNGNGSKEDALIMHRDIDQLANAINLLKTDPDNRRINVTAWNPGRTWQAALPPCHLYFQFNSRKLTDEERQKLLFKVVCKEAEADRKRQEDLMFPEQNTYRALNRSFFGEGNEARYQEYLAENGVPERALSLTVVLRSSDLPLGAVFNVAQYAYLLHMVAHVVGMEAENLITIGVDAHIYKNQIDKVRSFLDRSTIPGNNPKIVFKRKVTDIDDFKFEDVEIIDYIHGEHVDIPVAV